MNVRRFVCRMACAAALALGVAGAHAQNAPSIITNAEDYLPGETVIMMGSGFQPGETVDISIAIDDDENGVHIGDYDWMVELADDTGDFITFWTVPAEAYGMTLRATALGLSSGSVATHTFYDNHGTHNVAFRIVGMETRLPADAFFINVVRAHPVSHLDASQTVLVWTNGTTSASIGAAAQTRTISYGGFASTYTVTSGANAGVYNLVSTNPPSGFASGLSGETTTVVVTYSFTPACSATNNVPPTLSATDISLGDSCPSNGVLTTTVNVQDFFPVTGDPHGDPVTVTFADGSLSQVVVFDAFTPTRTLILRAVDNPTGRNQPNCSPLLALATDVYVTVSASVFSQPTNDAPVVSASNLNLGDVCASGLVTVSVSLNDFNASAIDPNNDPFGLSLQGTSQVTLELPPGVSDAVVSVPVLVTATDDPSARDCGICSPLSPMTGSTIAYVTAHLHRNTAPVITASNAHLGNIVGVMAGNNFTTNVAVNPSMFGAAATDADGDPVTITASVSNITLAGPGMASATVTLTAVDDPSSRTNGACVASSTSIPVQVSARVVYRFQGPLFPLSDSVAIKVRRGSIVPVSFRLFDANNVEVRRMLVNPAGGPNAHTIAVAFNQANAPDGAVDIDEISLDCDDVVDFNYVLVVWNLLLWTNNSYQVNTTYRIRIYTNDGQVHSAMISIKR